MIESHEPVEIHNPSALEDEAQIELSLRPTKLSEYIGQRKVKDNLRVFMEAALTRRESLDHVLLTGPPGVGKTTLSAIISNEMGSQLKSPPVRSSKRRAIWRRYSQISKRATFFLSMKSIA